MATPRGILNSLFNNFTAHLLNPVLKHLNNETPAYQLSHPAHVSKKVLETTSQYLSNVFSNLSNSTSAPSVCTPAAYHEFPPDLFTSYQRSHGAMVVHLIVIVYMFVALSIVCDDFFVTSLDKICEKLGFSEDVAGATFMAAGSSAPELFTSIIGVFITKGDVGVGTIVGSAVFNVLFVIGICALCSGQVVPLSWWPLCRDSIFYSFSVVILILVVIDGKVTWYESLMMLFLYVLYIVLMRFNQNVQAWVNSKVRKAESTELLAINGTALKDLGKSFQGDYEMFNNDEDEVFSRETARQQQPDQPVDEYIKAHNKQMTVPELVFRLLMLPNFHCKSRFRAAVRLVILCRTRLPNRMAQQRRQKFQSAAQQLSIVSYTKSARSWFSMTYEGENFDQWKVVSHPRDGVFRFLRWLISYPIHVVLYFTVPDSRKSRWEKWFMVTFLMSIFWIAIFSYIMVWMVTLIGFTLRIPDSVMGITFLAAGTSIPDAMASVFVVKQGQGDMAVSNSVGSNVFDILLGLAFPWFLMTGLVFPGSTVQINSNGMVYSIILLFLTVISTISVIYFAGWCLNKTVGITCLVVYAIYLVFSVMIECNQFGYVNPPMCVA